MLYSNYNSKSNSFNIKPKENVKIKVDYWKSQEFTSNHISQLVGGITFGEMQGKQPILTKNQSAMHQKVALNPSIVSPMKPTPDKTPNKNQGYKIPLYRCEYAHSNNLFCNNSMWLKCRSRKIRDVNPHHEYIVKGNNWEFMMQK